MNEYFQILKELYKNSKVVRYYVYGYAISIPIHTYVIYNNNYTSRSPFTTGYYSLLKSTLSSTVWPFFTPQLITNTLDDYYLKYEKSTK
jgi:hypothetical protein